VDRRCYSAGVAFDAPRCSPGHHAGEALPIPDLDPDEPRTHACFECCELYDPESVEMWRDLERLIADTGQAPAIAS